MVTGGCAGGDVGGRKVIIEFRKCLCHGKEEIGFLPDGLEKRWLDTTTERGSSFFICRTGKDGGVFLYKWVGKGGGHTQWIKKGP